MKKLIISFVLCIGFFTATAQTYRFTHGPYLQELTPEAVTFVFTSNQKGISWVELQSKEGTITRHYATQNGLREAFTTFNTIRVTGLIPNTAYTYRLGSKEIVDFQPYKVSFGDSITSPWYSFKTLNPASRTCSFVALSDIHQDAQKLEKLLQLGHVERTDMVFYIGDMMNYYADEEVPFQSFIDKSVELFASQRPFVLVRGNHETRGSKAREYIRYVPKSDGHFYGAYRVGEVMFVILDCGEDKPDSTAVYAGLTDFDTYRTEQAEWFAQVIRSKAYKSAKWRIVMNHFPPIDPPEPWHGTQEITEKFLPLFNRARIDLMICGHTHQYSYLEPATHPILNFPVIINSTESIARVDIEGKTMKVKVVDLKNNTLKELSLKN